MQATLFNHPLARACKVPWEKGGNMHSVRASALALAFTAAVGFPALAQSGGISGDNVKIGVLTDMSGQFSHESGEGAVTAVRMAVEDFGGKVLGKPIEVVVADHQNKPDVALAIARKWFELENVDMIANLINSSIALNVSNLAKDKNRIAIINGSGASRLTGDACTPNSVHYAYDTYALARGTGAALMKAGGTSWFFLTADYAFGHALEADTSAVVKGLGGQVVGSVRYPVESIDQSSFLLQAQASRAKVVGLAGSGTVFVNAVKAAQEFGIRQGGQTLAGLLVWITDIKSLGLETAQGLVLTNAFYWDRDEDTRSWSKRFFDRMKRMPHMGDAGDYSSTMHYLKAIEAAKVDEAQAVMAKMREMPINDFFAKNGRIRVDGRMVHDMYVYEVKKPSESKAEWDYYKLRAVIPGDEAFRPLSESACPLVKKG
jgi:branched-chain amino acid transport system substrate-binding protein